MNGGILVLDVGEERMGDTGFFAAIDAEMEAGGLEAMASGIADVGSRCVRADMGLIAQPTAHGCGCEAREDGAATATAILDRACGI